MASWSDFSRLWAVGAALHCLVPGFEMARSEAYCFLKCKSQVEEVVQTIDSGLVSFHMKGIFPDESLVISKTCLSLGKGTFS